MESDEARPIALFPRPFLLDKLGEWCLKAVEAWPELDETSDNYDGIMKTQVEFLWELWKDTTDQYPVAYLEREADGTYDPLACSIYARYPSALEIYSGQVTLQRRK
ncbi:hypothetical protein ASPVEDRAFT_881855 [Aspergillus versicolor CBS 583.65]|uniref:Uncharacterized protein n=1 Tax=Aspergillus versicolor CBS 583.65 TaxID=1036611 RepID=A0A1L9PBB0_ASPVE|nr:uncharacterized protein ASPVEDRAFT_881855 [Aspergillus versicolor CBS 583.65]OJI98798.1 hypothetical protein ASPVEDRAFT_881855 [Aspergillus versicolor CBS 583.65]